MFYNRTCSPSPYFKVTYPVTAPSVFKATCLVRGPALRHRISRLPISLQDLNTHRSLRSPDLLQHLFFLDNHALPLSLFYPTRHQSSHHPTQVAPAPNVGKQVVKPKPEAGRPSGYKVDVALLLFTDKASEGANAAPWIPLAYRYVFSESNIILWAQVVVFERLQAFQESK